MIDDALQPKIFKINARTDVFRDKDITLFTTAWQIVGTIGDWRHRTKRESISLLEFCTSQTTTQASDSFELPEKASEMGREAWVCQAELLWGIHYGTHRHVRERNSMHGRLAKRVYMILHFSRAIFKNYIALLMLEQLTRLLCNNCDLSNSTYHTRSLLQKINENVCFEITYPKHNSRSRYGDKGSDIMCAVLDEDAKKFRDNLQSVLRLSYVISGLGFSRRDVPIISACTLRSSY